MLKISSLLFFSLIFFLNTPLKAHNHDSLDAMRRFIFISSNYKQVPFHLQLVQTNSTNYPTSPDDTTSINGEFFITDSAAYIRFGDIEEVTDNNRVVIISYPLKQMIVYQNATRLLSFMRKQLVHSPTDTSAILLLQKYRSEEKKLNKRIAQITLFSRQLIPGTNIPKQMIQLQYFLENNEPYTVLTTESKLILKSNVPNNILFEEQEKLGKVVTIKDDKYLINEQHTTFLYKNIDHDPKKEMPVLIKHRLSLEESSIKPAKGFESFKITIND